MMVWDHRYIPSNTSIPTMNHSIDNLDDCIFDYLAARPGVPVHISQIYDDITKDVGHRCSDLNDTNNKDSYRKRFTTVCYIVNSTFPDIHKLFVGDELFLVFSDKPHADVVREFRLHETPKPSKSNKYTVDSAIDHLLEYNNYYYTFDFDMNSTFTEDDPIIHIIVRKDRQETLDMILRYPSINIDSRNKAGKSAIDIAHDMGNTKMVEKLVTAKYKNELDRVNRMLTETCTRFRNQRIKHEDKTRELWQTRIDNRLFVQGLLAFSSFLYLSTVYYLW